MQPRFLVRTAITVCATTMIAFLVLSVYRPVDAAAVLTAGKADLKSAGALAFGPDGVLFVGDSIGGAIVALDTNDKAPVKTATINVQGLDQKIAGLVGVMPDRAAVSWSAFSSRSNSSPAARLRAGRGWISGGRDQARLQSSRMGGRARLQPARQAETPLRLPPHPWTATASARPSPYSLLR